MNRETPIVIGGGPAGAAAAICLLKKGARAIVYERQAEPGDALCGGFLSWKTLRRLERLGVGRGDLGGQPVNRLRLTAGEQEWSCRLPGAGMGVSRRRLDGLLLDRARALGADVRHATVRFENGNFCLAGGNTLPGGTVFLATGKHELRGLPRPHAEAGNDPFLGLRVRFQPSAPLAGELSGVIEMHMFPGGYAGIVIHEDGSANLCMAVRKSRLAEAGGDPCELFQQLARHRGPLGERAAALPVHPAFDAIGHIPYGWCAREGRMGVYRLGDQAGVIASLAGEGIGIALASAEMAVRYWRNRGPRGAYAFQRALSARLRPRLALAGMIAGLGADGRCAPWLGYLAMVPGLAGLMARATRV